MKTGRSAPASRSSSRTRCRCSCATRIPSKMTRPPCRPIPIPTRRSIRRRVSRGVSKHIRRRASVLGPYSVPPNQVYTTNPNLVAANQPRYDIPTTDIETMTVKADLGFANFTSLSQYRARGHPSVDRSSPDRSPDLPAWTADLRLHDQPGIPADLQARSAPAMDGGPLLLELPRYVCHLH